MDNPKQTELCQQALARMGRPAEYIEKLADEEREQLASTHTAYPAGMMFGMVAEPILMAVDARCGMELQPPPTESVVEGGEGVEGATSPVADAPGSPRS